MKNESLLLQNCCLLTVLFSVILLVSFLFISFCHGNKIRMVNKVTTFFSFRKFLMLSLSWRWWRPKWKKRDWRLMQLRLLKVGNGTRNQFIIHEALLILLYTSRPLNWAWSEAKHITANQALFSVYIMVKANTQIHTAMRPKTTPVSLRYSVVFVSG